MISIYVAGIIILITEPTFVFVGSKFNIDIINKFILSKICNYFMQLILIKCKLWIKLNISLQMYN